MIYHMYALCDALTGFLTPTVDQSDASAIRNFRMACDSHVNSSLISFKPDDFSLYHLADFDSSSGVVTSVNPPRMVVSGRSFMEVE